MCILIMYNSIQYERTKPKKHSPRKRKKLRWHEDIRSVLAQTGRKVGQTFVLLRFLRRHPGFWENWLHPLRKLKVRIPKNRLYGFVWFDFYFSHFRRRRL